MQIVFAYQVNWFWCNFIVHFMWQGHVNVYVTFYGKFYVIKLYNFFVFSFPYSIFLVISATNVAVSIACNNQNEISYTRQESVLCKRHVTFQTLYNQVVQLLSFQFLLLAERVINACHINFSGALFELKLSWKIVDFFLKFENRIFSVTVKRHRSTWVNSRTFLITLYVRL